ncbi:MAG TPA: group II truncated hemoglobin [Phenylobacterium sp.]|nr:group II truncated hemoglobin [Phenylobacterium sp.]
MTDTVAPTPFDMIGGDAVAAFVERFYDLMDSDPQYAALRALHAPDLGPMRDSLTGFLTAWLGGPRDWFEQRPGTCMMSAHASVPVSPQTARQWTEAMSRALEDTRLDEDLAAQINAAFARMAQGMAGR